MERSGSDDIRDDFTMEFDETFKKIARWLSRGDTFLAEELRNVMHVAILEWSDEKRIRDSGAIIKSAKCKAIDYLRSKAFSHSYRGKVKHNSYESLGTAGFQIDSTGMVHRPGKDTRITMRLEDTSDPDEMTFAHSDADRLFD